MTPRIQVEPKTNRDLRKLARALLLLAQQQAKDKKAGKSEPKRPRR